MVVHLGDSGKTWGSIYNTKTSKNHALINFYGSADKCVSYIALIISELDQGLGQKLSISQRHEVRRILELMVDTLFNISAFFATGKSKDLKKFKKEIDEFEEKYEKKLPNEFILYFKSPLAARLNFLRTLIREHERSLYNVLESEIFSERNKIDESLQPIIQSLLNRLSTIAFILSIGVEKGFLQGGVVEDLA